MRHGIFGGSFDPVHNGHIAVAEAVLRLRALDRLYLVPASSPPHKEGGCRAAFADRVAMARLATAPIHGLEVSDLEGRRPGPSYTIDTVEALLEAHPDAGLEILVGADMLADLPGWRRAAALVEVVRVVAFARPGTDVGAAGEIFDAAFGGGRYSLVEVPAVAVSSSGVRDRLAAGQDVGTLLAGAVREYISERGLYGNSG